MLEKRFHKKKDRSITMSAPKEYELYGVRIHKLPVSKYIRVLQTLEDLPSLLLGEEARTGGLNSFLQLFSDPNRDAVAGFVGHLLTVVPGQLCNLLSELLDIPRERLLDNDCGDALSLNELTEVILAFWEMNDMSDFFKTVRRLTGKPGKANTGSSAGSPSAKA